MKTPCMSLQENGCRFEKTNRPSGGVSFIPKENGLCEESVSKDEELKKYIPYQKTLQRLVKKFTGMSFEAKLKEDIENLIFDLLSDNFTRVSKIELNEMKNLFPLLIQAYPEQFQKAKKKYKQNQLLLTKKIKY